MTKIHKDHIAILRGIIDEHDHSIDVQEIKEAIYNLRDNLADDFNLEFDGNEYRIISEGAIWDIYVQEIKNIVTDCYDLKLDNIPHFVSVNIDWEQTARNAYSDGYGHTFSSYDGSEIEINGYWVFRVG